jgi:hypothetical protein
MSSRLALNWILTAPSLFVETLNDLDKKAREVMLFQFKKEIERYHEKKLFKRGVGNK